MKTFADSAKRTHNSARDLAFALVLVYAIVPTFLPSLSKTATILLLFVHALAWRAFHSFALGLALKKQSERRWIVRHFIKHYHYERDGDVSSCASCCRLSTWSARVPARLLTLRATRRPFVTLSTTGRLSTTCLSA